MTRLNNDLKTGQSAITVLLDEQREPGALASAVRNFLDKKEYVDCADLLEGSTFPTGRAVFDKMFGMIRRGIINRPQAGRFVFCHYLPAEKLTDSWVDNFFSMAREFRNMVPTDYIDAQRFLVCVSLRSGEVPGERQPEIMDCLARLVREKPAYFVQPYLLRVSGFEGFDRQQEAMAVLLYLLGRQDYSLFLPSGRGVLRMVDAIEYYRDQTSKIQSKLDALADWRNKALDPNQEGILQDIRGIYPGAIQKQREAGRMFTNMEGLFGIRVDEFGGFRHNHRPDVQGNPYLQKRREEFLMDKMDKIVDEANVSNIEKRLSMYLKKDLERLEISLDDESDESLKERSFEGLEKQTSRSPVLQKLVERLFFKAEKVCRRKMEELPELEKQNEEDSNRLTGELNAIVPFRDLKDCFNRIDAQLPIGEFKGNIPTNLRKTALVSGEVVQDWEIKRYEIQGVQNAYHCPDIATVDTPREIVLLKECDILDLTQGNLRDNTLIF